MRSPLEKSHYGAAESALAVAAISGSVAAGLLAEKLKIRGLPALIASLGFFMIPARIAFAVPIRPITKYAINVVSFCGMQIAISVFSVFAVSLIQQRTPDRLIGKVMAYTSAIPLCAQPIGQIVYGFLFDRFSGAVYFVFVPAGLIVSAAGLLAAGFFKNIEKTQSGDRV